MPIVGQNQFWMGKLNKLKNTAVNCSLANVWDPDVASGTPGELKKRAQEIEGNRKRQYTSSKKWTLKAVKHLNSNVGWKIVLFNLEWCVVTNSILFKVLPCRCGTWGKPVTKEGAILRGSIRGSCCNGYKNVKGLVKAVYYMWISTMQTKMQQNVYYFEIFMD